MAFLQNRSSQLLKYTRLFNNGSVTRLSSNTVAKSSAEVIQREKKVSANNYDPSPVVISRGEGKSSLSVEIIKTKKVLRNHKILFYYFSNGYSIGFLLFLGIFMWDVEGKKYYDFVGGFATLNQGHCHPKIVKALTDQVGKLHHTSRAIFHDSLYELNEFLSNQFGYEKVLNMNTGKIIIL